MRIRLFVMGLALLVPIAASGQPVDDTSLDEDLPPPPVIDETDEAEPGDGSGEDDDGIGIGGEFELAARDRVISAARTETTIQEVPAIVTVITREEIEARGFRTVNEIIATIPGFEGDRSEGNQWTIEPISRGNPYTLLILINGISIVEPARNQFTMDRKLPVSIIERIEVTSGPGGVLWGSNAFLGVVNIITRTGRDSEGITIQVGGGTGPGELEAVELNTSYGGELFNDIMVFANLNFFTSRGSEVTPEDNKVVGVLPAPDPDGVSLYLAEPMTSDGGREYYGSLFLDVRGGPLTFHGFFEMEQDRRPLAFGGSLLTADVRSPELVAELGPVEVENVADDSFWLFALNYHDRFADDDVGLSLTAYFERWTIDEDPFGSFMPSDILPIGLATIFRGDGIYRTGLNIDSDVVLPQNNHLIFGGELFYEPFDGLFQTAPVNRQDPYNTEFVTDTLVFPIDRVIGAVYASDEWRASDVIALNAGARLQLSNAYDPAVLASAALVWNMFAETFMKLNYAEGFRPPSFQATNTNPNVSSGITLSGNPDLDVERSRAAQVELNSIFVEDAGWIERWFARVDYSFTILEDIILSNPQGAFFNSGTRHIHSVEFLSRVQFVGSHELTLAYYFVDAEDDSTGPIRNVANNIFNASGRIQIIPELLSFNADLTWVGPMEDANRRVPESETQGELVTVYPTDVYWQRIEPVALVRAGLRAENIADHYMVEVYGYNILDQTYLTPDMFPDDRVALRPYINPRWSFFATVGAEF